MNGLTKTIAICTIAATVYLTGGVMIEYWGATKPVKYYSIVEKIKAIFLALDECTDD